MNQSISSVLAQAVPAVAAAGLFCWSCTIQKPSGNVIPPGQPDNTYVNAEAGLVDIPAMAAPPSDMRIQATAVKDLQEILSTQLRHVLLQGFFPQIQESFDLENGEPYNHAVLTDSDGNVMVTEILGAECDSQAQMTRLTTRVASL